VLFLLFTYHVDHSNSRLFGKILLDSAYLSHLFQAVWLQLYGWSRDIREHSKSDGLLCGFYHWSWTRWVKSRPKVMIALQCLLPLWMRVPFRLPSFLCCWFHSLTMHMQSVTSYLEIGSQNVTVNKLPISNPKQYRGVDSDPRIHHVVGWVMAAQRWLCPNP
jgi:hypothetical protein